MTVARSGLRVADVPWADTFEAWPTGPALSECWAGGERRADAIRYHLWDRLEGYAKIGGAWAFTRMPPKFASNVTGKLLAPMVASKYRGKVRWNRMKRHLERLRPDIADDAAREAFLERWHENIGRALGELIITDRLIASDRIDVRGLEHRDAAIASGRPVIVTAMHMSAWEPLAAVSGVRHFDGARNLLSSWQPQANRFQNRLVARMRVRAGYKCLPPGPHLARRLRRVLGVPGQQLLLFIDEASEGTNKFPLFGRPMPTRCNFSFAMRIAAASNAVVLSFTGHRVGDGHHFVFEYHPPTDLAAFDGPNRVEDAARAVNAIYEPHTIRHIDEWYMLHNVRL